MLWYFIRVFGICIIVCYLVGISVWRFTNVKGFKSCLISMKLIKIIRFVFKVEVLNFKWVLKYLV